LPLINCGFFSESISNVRSSSVEFLRSLIAHIPSQEKSQSSASRLAEPVLNVLNQSLNLNDAMMQVQLLGLLRVILAEIKGETLDSIPLFHSSFFSSTILTGIQKAHEDFHAKHLGNSVNLTQESLSLLSHWVWFSVSCLPFLRKALATVSFSCVTVFCQEIQNPLQSKRYNSAHALLLYGLRGVVHHCVFQSERQRIPSPEEKSTANSSDVMFAPAQLIAGIFEGVFGSKEMGNRREEKEPLKEAQDAALEMLPIIIEAVVHAWEAASKLSKQPTALKLNTASETSLVEDVKTSTKRKGRSKFRSNLGDDDTYIEYQPRKNSGTYVVSSTLTLVHHEKKVKSEIIQLLTPLAKVYPKILLRAMLHAWEKAMASSATPTGGNQASYYVASDSGYSSHLVIIDILNSLNIATPLMVISSLSPLAV
jgi:hypothetical protein